MTTPHPSPAGARAWYAGTGPVITAAEVYDGWSEARGEAAAHVERILARLPGRERELVEAMAQMDPDDRTATKIARAMGFAGAPRGGPPPSGSTRYGDSSTGAGATRSGTGRSRRT